MKVESACFCEIKQEYNLDGLVNSLPVVQAQWSPGVNPLKPVYTMDILVDCSPVVCVVCSAESWLE